MISFYYNFDSNYGDPIELSREVSAEEEEIILNLLKEGKSIEGDERLENLLSNIKEEIIYNDYIEFPDDNIEITMAVKYDLDLDSCFENLHKCEFCGCTFEGELTNLGEMTAICEECLGENYIMCDKCGEYNDSVTEVNDENYCSSCLETYCGECAGCGEYFLRDDLVKAGDKYYCNICADDHCEKCDFCNEYFLSEDIYPTGEDYYVCKNCLNEHVAECTGCQDYFLPQNLKEVDGNLYCKDCIAKINAEK